jgi:hypothetical protein
MPARRWTWPARPAPGGWRRWAWVASAWPSGKTATGTVLCGSRQAQQIADEYSGGLDRGLSQIVTGVLIEAGDLAAAERVCTAALASCREVGDQGICAACCGT